MTSQNTETATVTYRLTLQALRIEYIQANQHSLGLFSFLLTTLFFSFFSFSSFPLLLFLFLMYFLFSPFLPLTFTSPLPPLEIQLSLHTSIPSRFLTLLKLFTLSFSPIRHQDWPPTPTNQYPTPKRRDAKLNPHLIPGKKRQPTPLLTHPAGSSLPTPPNVDCYLKLDLALKVTPKQELFPRPSGLKTFVNLMKFRVWDENAPGNPHTTRKSQKTMGKPIVLS